jgi:hypothetical protein
MNLAQARLSGEGIVISIAPRTHRANSAVRLSLYGKSKKTPGFWWQTGKLFHSGDGDFLGLMPLEAAERARHQHDDADRVAVLREHRLAKRP